MAVRVFENKTFTSIQSDVTPVGTVIDMGRIDSVKPHCFAGLQFFADSGGQTQAVPTAGTVLVEIQTLNSFPIFEAVPSGLMDLAQPRETVSWAANTVRVRATPLSVNVATHYRLVATCNET